MKKTLTISGHRRPDYFAQVLGALSFCDGVSEYAVTAVLDPVLKRQSMRTSAAAMASLCKLWGIRWAAGQ